MIVFCWVLLSPCAADEFAGGGLLMPDNVFPATVAESVDDKGGNVRLYECSVNSFPDGVHTVDGAR